MIGRLRGTIVERTSDGSCVVDVAGVGYEVFVPESAYEKLPPSAEPVTLAIHTHVREDALVLYGFASLEDRAAFRALLGVASIGPKLALAILGRLDATALGIAVARGDKAAFKGISGVGKKTVERVLLDLRDKLPIVAARPSAKEHEERVPHGIATGPLASVISALVNLGYKPAEAEHAVDKIASSANGKPTEVLIREALGALG